MPSDRFFNLILLAATCAGILMIFLEIQRARNVRTWPQTSGRVTATRLTTVDAYAGDAYACEVDYEYTVDGSRYVGSQELSIFHIPFRGLTKEPQEGYQPGDELVIAYNPTRKGESLLAGGARAEVGIGTILIGVVMAAGALLWLLIRTV